MPSNVHSTIDSVSLAWCRYCLQVKICRPQEIPVRMYLHASIDNRIYTYIRLHHLEQKLRGGAQQD